MEEANETQRFLHAKMERHQNVSGSLATLRSIVSYFTTGEFIVDLGHWVVLTSGRIAETALLFATLWVTFVNVTPETASKLGAATVTSATALAMMAFSLLPEVILFSAIVACYKHWLAVVQHKKAGRSIIGDTIWASLYTLPTLAFVGMTVYTITSFTASQGHVDQSTGMALAIRCLAGWSYSLIGLIHSSIRKLHHEPFQTETMQALSTTPEQSVEIAIQQTVERLMLINEQQNNQLLERHIESLNQHMNETLRTIKKTVSVTLEQTTLQRDNGSTQHILKTGKRAPQQLEQKSESLSFDRKQFVYECLLHDTTMSAPAIQLKAEHEQKKLSIGSISNYRKAFFNDHPELSMKAEQDASIPEIESLQDLQDADDVVIIEAL